MLSSWHWKVALQTVWGHREGAGGREPENQGLDFDMSVEYVLHVAVTNLFLGYSIPEFHSSLARYPVLSVETEMK